MYLKNAKFDNKESFAIVSHRGLNFFGFSTLHPEDEPSKFFGCKIAEMRATIKALKYELALKKEKCEECRKFVNAVSQQKNFDKTSSTAKAMYHQLNIKIKEVNKLIDEINKIQKDIQISIKQREIVSNAIKQNKLKKK